MSALGVFDLYRGIRLRWIVPTLPTDSLDTIRVLILVPRMTRHLWPEALSTQNLGQVAEYITSRIKIPDCKGSRGGAVSDRVS